MDKIFNLTGEELHIINKNIESAQMKFRAISVLAFIKPMIIENNGYLRISIRELNEFYQRDNFKFSDTLMKKIIMELINLKLLEIDREQPGTVYFLPQKLQI